MVSQSTSFAPAFGQVKVDQITESRISSVVAMLPTSLQAGPIRFLRRSISLHTLRPGITISGSRLKGRPLSEVDGAVLQAEPLAGNVMERIDSPQYLEAKAVRSQPMSRVLYSESREDERVPSAASGVHWKFARQGSSLVSISMDGGKPAVAEDDVIFERKAFIDGVTYLLKALPHDLDACEMKRIQCALPQEVFQPSSILALPEDASTRDISSQPRSILHRGVQKTVVNLVFFLSIVMPYLLYLVRCAARLERRYKVSETVVGHGLDFVNSIGRQSALFTETIGQMNDGKVGQAVLEAFVWTVNGVTQGISDGLGEGLSIVGSRPMKTA
ncbi:hypothetical protein FZEAL_7440 [Fusarium zealandicum]|uniref:Uncharacterized protein n=1 Tax=Fusarium zealandicum TaxID=1053134 RepID=A0A8H4XHV2_9HYPO|nr:hypothetical protein FZEAL_7440 [Fusarium zealandicum]